MLGKVHSLAFRHLLALILVSVLFTAVATVYQAHAQFTSGVQARDAALDMISESYVPPVAASVFFFDEQQLSLLLEGIALITYVHSVEVFEFRSGEEIPIAAAGKVGTIDGETRVYPLVYEYAGQQREIGVLRVTTSLSPIRRLFADQLRVTILADLLKIFGFALVVLVVAQQMIFRHLSVIAGFFHDLSPEQISYRELLLHRRTRRAAVPDELDEITGAVNTMLSRLETALNEKTTLLRELHHRTGNLMQSVRSILRLQSSKAPENEQLQEVVNAVNNRVLAMALVHQKLYTSANLSRIDMSEYLTELAHGVLRSFDLGKRQVQLKVDVEEPALLIDSAIPCGLIVSELLSNSLEHAFPEERGGTIWVKLHRSEEGSYRLSVADDGVGVQPGFDYRYAETLGLQSVMALAEQLHARIEFEGQPGVRWSIVFSEEGTYRERVHT